MLAHSRILLAAGLLAVASRAQLVVSVSSGTNGANQNTIKQNLRLENRGTTAVDLAKTTLDYLVFDATSPSNLVVECWYASGASCVDMSAEIGAIPLQQDGARKADIRIRLGFARGQLAAGQTLEIQWGLHEKSYLSLFDESDDWSSVANDGQWHVTTRVAVNASGSTPTVSGMQWKGVVANLPDPVGAKNGDVVRSQASGETFVFSDGAWVLLSEAGKGGPAGPAGATGVQGPAGAQGAQGVAGPAGTAGAPGATGATGSVGPKGDKGEKGDAGSGSGGSTPSGLETRVKVLEALVARMASIQTPDPNSFVDLRDGKVYKTVVIGTQTWMAQNLNYGGETGAIGACYDGKPENCDVYGRLYTWSTALGIAPGFDAAVWGMSDAGVRGLCPDGWHVPSDYDWSTLVREVAKTAGAGGEGHVLKATSGWGTSVGVTGNGSDLLGFRGLPAGSAFTGAFHSLGTNGEFWTATEFGATHPSTALFRGLSFAGTVERMGDEKASSFSVRCLKNAP